MSAEGASPARPGAAPSPERIWVEIAREMCDDGSYPIDAMEATEDRPYDPKDADYPYQELVEYVRADVAGAPSAPPEPSPSDLVRLIRESIFKSLRTLLPSESYLAMVQNMAEFEFAIRESAGRAAPPLWAAPIPLVTRDMVLAAERAEIEWQNTHCSSNDRSVTDARKDRLRVTLLAAFRSFPVVVPSEDCSVCGGSGESEGGLTKCPGCGGSRRESGATPLDWGALEIVPHTWVSRGKAWVHPETLRALRSTESAGAPSAQPEPSPDGKPMNQAWPWAVYTTAYGLRIRHEIDGHDLDLYDAAKWLNDYDEHMPAALGSGAPAKPWCQICGREVTAIYCDECHSSLSGVPAAVPSECVHCGDLMGLADDACYTCYNIAKGQRDILQEQLDAALAAAPSELPDDWVERIEAAERELLGWLANEGQVEQDPLYLHAAYVRGRPERGRRASPPPGTRDASEEVWIVNFASIISVWATEEAAEAEAAQWRPACEKPVYVMRRVVQRASEGEV